MESLQCTICKNYYSDVYVPRVLACGHTYCEECLKSTCRKHIFCPSVLPIFSFIFNLITYYIGMKFSAFICTWC